MKALNIILMALAFISFQAHAEESSTASPVTASEAFVKAKKAAEGGDAVAQCNLGLHYVDGRGAAKDPAEASRWFLKSAKQGNANGQFELGYLYETGKGVTKDLKEAANWYQKAAGQGNSSAAQRLESMNAQSKLDAKLTHKGSVISSIDGGGYTYIELTENGKTVWIAAPMMVTKKGDSIRFTEGAPMTKYYSKSLNRTFESVTFVESAIVGSPQ